MTVIEAQQSNVTNVLRDVASRNAAKNRADTSGEKRDDAPQGRAVHDTVSLSDGGHKIVNLNRAAELGTQIKDAPVDKDFADNLMQASNDVFRIGRLFTQSIRAVFNWWK